MKRAFNFNNLTRSYTIFSIIIFLTLEILYFDAKKCKYPQNILSLQKIGCTSAEMLKWDLAYSAFGLRYLCVKEINNLHNLAYEQHKPFHQVFGIIPFFGNSGYM